MEIANSEIIDSLYRAHNMAIENNDYLNKEEKFVLQTIFQKIQKDETLSFESKKSMFVLLDKAIADAHMNGNIPKFDKALFSTQTELHEQEYDQAIRFFVTVKNDEDKTKQKINKIYLNFLSEIYYAFNVGDISYERAFAVKAYEELGKLFDHKGVLTKGTEVDLKSTVENLTKIYSNLGDHYKKHQQEKLEQQKVIEHQKAEQIEKNKIAEEILNKLSNISVLGKLKHIDHRCHATKEDIKSFFLQPSHNMSENDVNDIFDILSDYDVDSIIFSGLDITNFSNKNLGKLKEISEKLDKPAKLIEQNLIQLVNNTLLTAINKRSKELEPHANSIYRDNNKSKIKVIEDVERNINYSIQNKLDIEANKEICRKKKKKNIENLTPAINDFKIAFIHNPKTLSIVNKFKFKRPQFNFASKFTIFDKEAVDELIASIKSVSGDYDKVLKKNTSVETFLKKIEAQYEPYLKEVGEKFALREKILKKAYLKEYVSKKWYSFLGPVAKWAVNKFSKKFLQRSEANYSDELKRIVETERDVFRTYKKEVISYIDEKLKYSIDDIKYDEHLEAYNTYCQEADNLYHQVINIHNEKNQIINAVLQNTYHDGTYFNINDIEDFSSKTTKAIQNFNAKITELGNMIQRLQSNIDKLPHEFKEELAENFKIFSKDFKHYKREAEKHLGMLHEMLTNAELIHEKNNMLSKTNENLKSEQTKLNDLKAELTFPADKAINKILIDLKDNDETIKKLNATLAKIVSKPNLSTVFNLINDDLAKNKIANSIVNNFSSAATGGQA